MRENIFKIITKLSQLILKKYQPQIIGITGSVGKTSAKEAVDAVLSDKFRVRSTIKNYNNEIGVPLSIIGQPSGGSSVLGWCKVFYHAIKLLLITDKKYPQILILEMGADKPGDIEYLISLAPLNVGILTAVSEAHLEKFKNLEGVLKEKEKIVLNLPINGRAVINSDDPLAVTVVEKVKGNYFTFGFGADAEVRAIETYFTGVDGEACNSQNDWDCKMWGTGFKVKAKGSAVPVFLPHALGRQHIYAALAAISVGLHYEMNLLEISEGLRRYKTAKGRMNVLAGVKGTLIIDDTYNSSPRAVFAALDVLKDLKVHESAHKFVVLGDMLELGENARALHQEVGKAVAESGVDYLFGIGELSDETCMAAKEAGMSPLQVYHFMDRDEATKFLKDLISSHDIIFVKGSQGMRMEKTVESLLVDPKLAGELLVRHGEEW